MAIIGLRNISLICAIILLCVPLFSWSAYTSNHRSWDESKIKPFVERQVTHAQLVSPPIRINDDNDFVTQGFSGSGTAEDPYVIDNRRIEADEGIVISDVASHFVITDCVIWTHMGVSIDNTQGFAIHNNEFRQFFGGEAISVMGSSDFIIVNNTIVPDFVGTNDWAYEYGIYIRQSSNGLIEGNSFTDCGRGVDVGGSNFTITDNVISPNLGMTGIYAELENSVISGNDIPNYDDGIMLQGGSDNSVSDNWCFRNYRGISLFSSQRNNITGNTCLQSDYTGIGIFHDSSFNIISENWMEDNDGYGLELSAGGYPQQQIPTSNQVFRNVFISNNFGNIQASDSQGRNGFGYNYWSDWTHQEDEDNDGFLDEPYPIDGSPIFDRHPLVNESLAFSLAIDSVPIPGGALLLLQGNTLTLIIASCWIAILVIPNVKWYVDSRRAKI